MIVVTHEHGENMTSDCNVNICFSLMVCVLASKQAGSSREIKRVESKREVFIEREREEIRGTLEGMNVLSNNTYRIIHNNANLF
jgi:hypothetical protein